MADDDVTGDFPLRWKRAGEIEERGK